MATLRTAQRSPLEELRRTWLFSACTNNELRAVASLCTPIDVRAGRVLIREGEIGGECFIVLSGQVVVERGQKVLGHDVRHSIIGLLAMIDRQTHTATVTAVTDMYLLVLDRREFATLASGEVAWSIQHRIDVIAAEQRDRRTAAARHEPPRVYMNRPVVDVVEHGFLASLSADERDAFESLGRRRHFQSGQVLFIEGDEGRDVVVLLDGTVKVVSVAPSGREVILEVIDRDELIGEMSAIDGQPRSATAVALTPVDVLVIPTARFLSFLEGHGSSATALLQLVVARLRNSSQRQLEFGTSDALGRLCACMLRMLDRYGATDERGRHVTMPLAQHEIAAMTGLSREAVVKGLRSLRALGWIDLQARDLTILDDDAMGARATSSACGRSRC